LTQNWVKTAQNFLECEKTTAALCLVMLSQRMLVRMVWQHTST